MSQQSSQRVSQEASQVESQEVSQEASQVESQGSSQEASQVDPTLGGMIGDDLAELTGRSDFVPTVPGATVNAGTGLDKERREAARKNATEKPSKRRRRDSNSTDGKRIRLSKKVGEILVEPYKKIFDITLARLWAEKGVLVDAFPQGTLFQEWVVEIWSEVCASLGYTEEDECFDILHENLQDVFDHMSKKFREARNAFRSSIKSFVQEIYGIHPVTMTRNEIKDEVQYLLGDDKVPFVCPPSQRKRD
ncbi:hypothetical protein BJ508DRAFT_316248, partial [Ascobolus immersus RN42]